MEQVGRVVPGQSRPRLQVRQRLAFRLPRHFQRQDFSEFASVEDLLELLPPCQEFG